MIKNILLSPISFQYRRIAWLFFMSIDIRNLTNSSAKLSL